MLLAGSGLPPYREPPCLLAACLLLRFVYFLLAVVPLTTCRLSVYPSVSCHFRFPLPFTDLLLIALPLVACSYRIPFACLPLCQLLAVLSRYLISCCFACPIDRCLSIWSTVYLLSLLNLLMVRYLWSKKKTMPAQKVSFTMYQNWSRII